MKDFNFELKSWLFMDFAVLLNLVEHVSLKVKLYRGYRENIDTKQFFHRWVFAV